MSTVPNRVIDTNDTGGGIDGTIRNAAWLTAIYNSIEEMAYTVIIPTSTGTQNNWTPGVVGNTVIKCNNASLLTITGIVGTVVTGHRLIIMSIGAGQVDLVYSSGSSSVGNKLINFATTGLTSLAAGAGVAEYVYDGSRWVMVSHEQGAPITPTFAAGDYTSPTGTWAVTAGEAAILTYYLRGRQLTVTYEVSLTTVTGTPAHLRRKIPGGATGAAGNSFQPTRVSDNGGGVVWGMAIASTADIQFFSTVGGGGWAASTLLTTVQGVYTVTIL